MTYEPAMWVAVAMGAVAAIRMRWWTRFPESRLFTSAFAALSASYILAVQPVVEGLNRISISVMGSAIGLLASVLLATIASSANLVVALEIFTGSRTSSCYVRLAWGAAASLFVVTWIVGDSRHAETLNSFSTMDLPAVIFAATYAVFTMVTALAAMAATWRALQRKDMRAKLRRATAGLFVAAVSTTGLSVTLLLDAFVLHLSWGSVQVIEQVWWIPITIGLAVAGL